MHNTRYLWPRSGSLQIHKNSVKTYQRPIHNNTNSNYLLIKNIKWYSNINLSSSKVQSQFLFFKRHYSKATQDTYFKFEDPTIFKDPKKHISDSISKLSGIDSTSVYECLKYPRTLDLGDIILPLPQLKLQNEEIGKIATDWSKKIPLDQYFEKIIAKGSFLQFYLSPKYLIPNVLTQINNQGDKFGCTNIGNSKVIVIEFSSPNIAKPFHAGHLRSTIIGGFLANLYETMGYEVKRLNYLGDWGKQFGLLAIGYKRYGDELKLKNDSLKHLFDVYVKVNQDLERESNLQLEEQNTNREARKFFHALENNEVEAINLWKKFKSVSMENYIQIYDRLNIQFSEYATESSVPKENIESSIKRLEDLSVLEKKDNATLINFTNIDKRLGKAVIKKSDGTSIYLSRDIAEAIRRYESYKFDKMIYVVASQQDLYMKQLFEAIRLLNYPWAKNLEHCGFGMILGMSTRKGNVIFLDNILNEARDKMHAQMELKNEMIKKMDSKSLKVADEIGIAAVMIQDMRSKRVNNYSFEWKRMLSFEGNTGPYLQYTHARLQSIEDSNNNLNFKIEEVDFSLLRDNDAIMLVRILSLYESVLFSALETSEPSALVLYLFRLCRQVSKCYTKLWVNNQEEALRISHFVLYKTSKQVLHNGLKILGITPVSHM